MSAAGEGRGITVIGQIRRAGSISNVVRVRHGDSFGLVTTLRNPWVVRTKGDADVMA